MIARFVPRALAGALAGIAIASSSAGCEDPSLRVVVERPTAYAGLVDRVEISVYERPGLTCDDIAYDKLSADELRAILRSSGSGDLGDIPRLGHKAVVARGYGRSGRGDDGERLVIAGCTEVDEISDPGERIVVSTEPVATAAIDSSEIVGGKGAVEIAVVGVDVNQKGIDGKEVRWTTYGPSGSFPTTGDISEPATPALLRGGEGMIRPAAPDMAGPYAVQVRIKWATGLPPPVSAMMANPEPTPRSLGAPEPTIVNACTIYARNGQPTLACLDRSAGRVIRSFRMTGGALVETAPPVSAVTAVGIYGIGAGVIAVNLDGSYTGAIGSTASGNVCQGGCSGISLVDVMGFEGCSGGAGGLLAHYRDIGVPPNHLVATFLATGEKRVFTTPAVSPTDPVLALSAVGCVSDLETSGAPQVTATVNTNNRSLIYMLSSPLPIERARDRRQAGSGFSTSGKEARLLTTELDPTGFIVVESVLNKPLAVYRLFERRRSPAVSPPRHYVSGRFDLDDEADVAWDVIDDIDNQTRAIQLLLAARPGRPTLLGRLKLADTSDLLTADLDGDGLSELVGYTANSVSVQRLGVLNR